MIFTCNRSDPIPMIMQRCPEPIQSFLSTAQRHSMAQSDAGTVLLFSKSQSLPVAMKSEINNGGHY